MSEFHKADVDKSGYLEEEEAEPFIKLILNNFSTKYQVLDPEEASVAVTKLFDWMDVDKSGRVTLREFKTSLVRAWYHHIPPGILDRLETESAE